MARRTRLLQRSIRRRQTCVAGNENHGRDERVESQVKDVVEPDEEEPHMVIRRFGRHAASARHLVKNRAALIARELRGEGRTMLKARLTAYPFLPDQMRNVDQERRADERENNASGRLGSADATR